MSKALPTDTAIGTTVSFVTGPTAVRVDGAEVTGHDGQFIVTKDAKGKVRKIRPGALRS